jgi:hypothetical protein
VAGSKPANAAIFLSKINPYRSQRVKWLKWRVKGLFGNPWENEVYLYSRSEPAVPPTCISSGSPNLPPEPGSERLPVLYQEPEDYRYENLTRDKTGCNPLLTGGLMPGGSAVKA